MIRIKNLSYFIKSKKIIDDLSFSIESGEKVFLNGGIGSGKTTIFKIISGISQAFYTGKIKGEVEVFGKRNFEDFIDYIYPVFQYPDEQIIFENVQDEVNSVIDPKIPEQIDELTSDQSFLLKKTTQLSDGQKQALIIYLALISGRECICLDEPFSHLHPSKSKELMRKIIKSGKTVVFSDKRRYFDREFGKYFDRKIDTGRWIFDEMELKYQNGNDFKDEKAVIVEDLFFSYYPDQNLLNGINLELNKGEVISIIGENGSGKTTLLKIISRILKGEGHLKVNGRVSLSLQYPNYSFVERSVKDELRLVEPILNKNCKNENGNEMLRVIERLGILHRHPHTLSAGESKLISIIKSFSGDIILLDEPMVGQEENFRPYLINWLREGMKSAIISTHDYELAFMCDRVFELKKGKLKEK